MCALLASESLRPREEHADGGCACPEHSWLPASSVRKPLHAAVRNSHSSAPPAHGISALGTNASCSGPKARRGSCRPAAADGGDRQLEADWGSNSAAGVLGTSALVLQLLSLLPGPVRSPCKPCSCASSGSMSRSEAPGSPGSAQALSLAATVLAWLDSSSLKLLQKASPVVDGEGTRHRPSSQSVVRAALQMLGDAAGSTNLVWGSSSRLGKGGKQGSRTLKHATHSSPCLPACFPGRAPSLLCSTTAQPAHRELEM